MKKEAERMVLIKRFVNWLNEEETGQGLVEYAFIIMLIAIAAAGSLRLIATPLNDIFARTYRGLSG